MIIGLALLNMSIILAAWTLSEDPEASLENALLVSGIAWCIGLGIWFLVKA